MSRSTPMVLAGLLALVAFMALGYTAWQERAKRISVEASYDALVTEANRLSAQVTSFETDIFNALQSVETEIALQRIVISDDQARRAFLVGELEQGIFGLYVEYAAATEIFGRLQDLVTAPTRAEREDIRDRFLGKVQDMRPYVENEEFLEGAPVDAKAFSTLITSIIALGTALGSVVTYVTSGGQRRVEAALAEVQLERAQIELAQMRYDAREALDYLHGKPAEDPS